MFNDVHVFLKQTPLVSLVGFLQSLGERPLSLLPLWFGPRGSELHFGSFPGEMVVDGRILSRNDPIPLLIPVAKFFLLT